MMQWDTTNKEKPNEKPCAIRAHERAIGRELRRMYDDVAQEPIPKDFLELLRRIYDDASIFPVIWVPEGRPKQWKRLNSQGFRERHAGFFRVLREFSLLFGQKRLN